MEKTTTVKEIIEALKEEFPGISGICDASEWSGKYEPGEVIHLGDAAEGGEIDGLPACDYDAYFHDPQEEVYILGVHKALAAFLEQYGYFVECYDAGTYLAFEM